MQLKFFLAASAASLSIACGLAAVPAAAQQITSGIEGTVTDDAGNPLTGATVTVTDTRTGAARTLTTGEGGTFSATGLTTGGPYTVQAEAAGFEGQTVSDIIINLQGNTSLSFALTSGSGTIVVSGSRVRVTQLAVGPGQSFTSEVLEAVPTFERDIRDVIRIDPRVSLDRNQESDRVSCLGGNDRANAFTVDGISQSDIYGLNDTPFSSRNGTPVPYDAIRETSVEFAPFSVEYGTFTGCAINAVTKSGSNTIHGNVFGTYSDRGLAGNSLAGLPAKGAVRDIRYGGTLGGPLIRDRLFLFGAYEHVEVTDSQERGPTGGGFTDERPFITVEQFNAISEVLRSRYGIETGGIATELPFDSDRYFVRADAYLTEDHRLVATYQRVEEAKVRGDDFSESTSTVLTGYNNFYQSGSTSNYYSGRLYSTWTDNFSTEIGYARSEVSDIQTPVGGGEAQDANPITRVIVGVQNGTSQGVFIAGPGFSRSANALFTTVDQFKAKGELVEGIHTLTFGAEANRANLNNLFLANATGSLIFRNLAALTAGTVNSATGNQVTTPSQVLAGTTYGAEINTSFSPDVNDAAANFTRTTYAVYAQDEIDLDRLTVTAGLRTEFYEGDRPAYNPRFAQRYNFPNNTSFGDLNAVFLPRLGFTYDVGDFGLAQRVIVKGGVGMFSGGDPVVWFGNAFQNNGALSAGTNIADAVTNGFCPTRAINVLPGGQFAGFPGCVSAYSQSIARAGGGDTQAIDPDIQVPTVIRGNLGLEAQLGGGGSFFSGWRLNLDYIYSRYENPLTIVDLSQVPDPRLGLGGFTIDGRPIIRAIDPTATGCTARLVQDGVGLAYTGVNIPCFSTARDDELELTNSDGYSSQIASIVLAKNFDRGLFTQGGNVFASFGYAYTDAQDRRSMYRSTAGSNFDGVAAFDRQNPPATRGFYASTHNATASVQFKEELFGEGWLTGFGFTAVARSGRPYSLTFGGTGGFYDSASGFDNALLYIPTGVNDPNLSPSSNATAVQNLVNYVNNLDCAKRFAGRTIERNTCENDWFYDVDLNFSQEIPGPLGRGDSFKFTMTVDNFLNVLNDEWNIFRRRDFEGLVNVVSPPGFNATTNPLSSPVDAQGRYIINTYAPDDQALIQPSSSLWRIKFGVSYEF